MRTQSQRVSSGFDISLVDNAVSERDLWRAVLHRAIKDAKLLMAHIKRNHNIWKNPLFRAEVEHLNRFFRSKSMQVGGFGFICDSLNIDPDQALKQIQARYLRHLSPTVQTGLLQTDCQA